MHSSSCEARIYASAVLQLTCPLSVGGAGTAILEIHIQVFRDATIMQGIAIPLA